MADDDPIRIMIGEEIERIRSEGREVRAEELEMAVRARLDALPVEEVRAVLAGVIEYAIESGEESPGDVIAKLFHPRSES